MDDSRVYLDYNAATPIDKRVAPEYARAYTEFWGNASSIHREGQASKALLADSRARIARHFGALPHQIVFFSTATEALTTLIRGLFAISSKAHIITSSTEQVAVWQCCRSLEKEGKEVTFLKTGPFGAVLPEDVEKAITDQTVGIAIMSVNNETGVITDIEAIAAIAQHHRIPLIVDGVAQLGKSPFRMYEGISSACFSSYKIYGPCGVGFAVLNRGVAFRPLIEGGGQESGRRGGSENVPAIYACSLALDLAIAEMPTASPRIETLRNLFEHIIFDRLQDVHINGEGPRIGNTSNLAFDNVDGEDLLIQLDLAGVSASHGAACSSGSVEASRVLLEMGFSQKRAASSIRFSFGRSTTENEIHRAAEILIRSVQQQRTH